jgi:hypothetical protein
LIPTAFATTAVFHMNAVEGPTIVEITKDQFDKLNVPQELITDTLDTPVPNIKQSRSKWFSFGKGSRATKAELKPSSITHEIVK